MRSNVEFVPKCDGFVPRDSADAAKKGGLR